jgi:hypothetical protein
VQNGPGGILLLYKAYLSRQFISTTSIPTLKSYVQLVLSFFLSLANVRNHCYLIFGARKMTREKQILFQWKSPLGPRAKSVPPEKWERHREELWSLYQRMTLDDLMAMMKVRHSFTPSYVTNL